VINYIILLTVHWFADFALQTHWQAANKSKNNIALTRHVLVYTACIGAASFVIFAPWENHTGLNWLGFVWLNFVLHFITDNITSRITSRLFMGQFDTFQIVVAPSLYGPIYPPQTETRIVMKRDFNPHYFFVVIGLDQLIHQVTLAITMGIMT